ncbi:cell division protein FtsQ [bacterium BMS3Bbin14]|nr:cell division protein FtsQ [bacterium BMS3Abin13]GBE53013.1 cell division protein FtsQ [bacterium BMS3Bbin14]
MYRPRVPEKVGGFRRLADWLATAARGLPARLRRRHPGLPHAVAARQRSWQLKKLSRRATFGLILVLLVVAGGWLSYRMVSASDIFCLTTVTIKGNKMTRDQQIIDAARLEPGGNLLALDTVRAAKMVEKLPWIAQARIKRYWPSTVEVIVQEHRPLALVNLGPAGRQRLFYVDEQGRVFAPLAVSGDCDFPVLTGTAVTGSLKDGQVMADSQAGQALALLQLAARGNQILPVQSISEVHVSDKEGLIVYLVDYPFPIYMGNEHIRTRYYQLVKILGRLYRRHRVKNIIEIRMNYAKNRILVASSGPLKGK